MFPLNLDVLTSALSWPEVGDAEGEKWPVGGREREVQARGARRVLGSVHVQRPGGGASGGKFEPGERVSKAR